jgi:hypothetical protein
VLPLALWRRWRLLFLLDAFLHLRCQRRYDVLVVILFPLALAHRVKSKTLILETFVEIFLFFLGRDMMNCKLMKEQLHKLELVQFSPSFQQKMENTAIAIVSGVLYLLLHLFLDF